jgi:hypothetical protein
MIQSLFEDSDLACRFTSDDIFVMNKMVELFDDGASSSLTNDLEIFLEIAEAIQINENIHADKDKVGCFLYAWEVLNSLPDSFVNRKPILKELKTTADYRVEELLTIFEELDGETLWTLLLGNVLYNDPTVGGNKT